MDRLRHPMPQIQARFPRPPLFPISANSSKLLRNGRIARDYAGKLYGAAISLRMGS